MKLFYGKNKIPILAPNHITVFDGKTLEFLWVKILVVLRMRVTANKIANINDRGAAIVEHQLYPQIAKICSLNYEDPLFHTIIWS